jgi:hypothetical protein
LFDNSWFKHKLNSNKNFCLKNKKKVQLFNSLILYDKLKYKTIKKNIVNIKNYKKFEL